MIAEKLRQAYHNDLPDVPLLLEAAEEIDQQLDLIRSLREDNHDLARQRDEAKQTLSDWTTDIGVRGFARRSELDAAKAEVETLTKQRDELKVQVERLLAKEGERISKALVK